MTALHGTLPQLQSRAWRMLPGLLLGLLAGCSSVPMPKLNTPLPAQWRNSVSAPAAAQPDLHGWWHRLHDPALDTLVDAALEGNLDVAMAVERLRAARALNGNPDAPFLPSLTLRTDDPIDPDASAAFFLAGFDSVWDLGLFGRRQGHARLARAQIDDAHAGVRAAHVSLVAEVVRNWIDLRAAQQRLRLLTRIHDMRMHAQKLLTLRAHLRLAAPLEVTAAQAQTAVAAAAMSEPRQAINAAVQRLALLLGRSEPNPAWLQPGPLPRLGQPALSSVPADLLRTRPEIARAQAAVLRSAGELGVARADRYPRIALGGSIDWSTTTLTHRNAPTNKIAAFGPIINIPLFDWGLRQARAHASNHLLRASVLAYRKAVLTGVAEVETALGSLAQQRQRELASTQAWQALQNATRVQLTRQRLGLADGITVADAGIARDQAGLDLLDAQATRDLAYVALYKALGGAPEPATAKTPGDDPEDAR